MICFDKNLILLPSDSHEDNADVDVQTVDRAGEPSVHLDCCFFNQTLVTSKSKWLLDGQRYLHLVSEGILANRSNRDHHRAHAVHDGDTVVVRQCARVIIPFPRTLTTQLLL